MVHHPCWPCFFRDRFYSLSPVLGPWGWWAPSPFSASLRRRARGAGAACHGLLQLFARTHPTAHPREGVQRFIS